MLLFLVLGIGIIVLAHTAPFPFLLEAFRPRDAVWHMPRDGRAPTIYLTYDDGPNPVATPALLDVLPGSAHRRPSSSSTTT
jgi:peptidoglycan/xylan/chitin deacetylase (PgdA/CDA1 family)